MSVDQDFDPHRTADGDFAWNAPLAAVPPVASQPGGAAPPPIPELPSGWMGPPAGPSPGNRFFGRANRWLGSLVHRVTLPEDDAPVDPFGKLVSTTPPWLISLIVHFSGMILLGLIALEVHHVATREDTKIEVDLAKPETKEEIYAERLGEQLDDPRQTFSTEGLEPSKDDIAALATSSDLPTVDNPLIGPPVLDASSSAEGNMPTGTVTTPMIGLEFSGREEGVKKALLKAYGGTALTEDSVKEGLKWLMRQQTSKGSWSLQGPYRNGTTVENTEAATAMALLAFQGAGYTPKGSRQDAYTRAVTRGWRSLLRAQQEDGHFFGNQTAEQHQLYTQAMCTIALCELYGMTRDDEYHGPAQKAVDYCVKIQASEGGWRYQPGIDSDLSVTGWFAMALQSARMAGLEVPSPVYAKIGKFLDSVARDEGTRYAYQPLQGATVALSAEGLLCRQYLGWKHDDPRLRGGVDYILANLPAWDKRNMYYWYYATQVCHHMEGSDWQKWNAVMRQLLPEHQEKNGVERGSWTPAGDRWGDAGGRLYVTCLSLYTLEVYYRHLPIYRKQMLDQ